MPLFCSHRGICRHKFGNFNQIEFVMFLSNIERYICHLYGMLNVVHPLGDGSDSLTKLLQSWRHVKVVPTASLSYRIATLVV